MKNISFRISPGADGLTTVNDRLRLYSYKQYEKGSLNVVEVGPNTFDISFSIVDDFTDSYWMPGNGLNFSSNTFPKRLKLLTSLPVDPASLTSSVFKLNGSTNISVANLSLEQVNLISINLSSYAPFSENTHFVEQIGYIYLLGGSRLRTTTWYANKSDVISIGSKDTNELYTKPVNIKAECLVVPKNSSVQEVLAKFVKTKNIRIIDSFFIPKQGITPTLGYYYIIYDDPKSFAISSIQPGQDAHIGSSSVSSYVPKIVVSFTKPLEAYSRDNLYRSVYVSNSNNTYYQAASSTYNDDASSITITPNASSIDAGVHFIRISGSNIQSINGERLALNGPDVYSSFTISSGSIGSGKTSGYYGSFYDTTDQAANLTTVAYPVNIDSTSESNQVSIVNGNEITFANKGVYSVTFSIQFTNAAVQAYDVQVWARKNGSDLPYSNSKATIPSSHGGIKGHYIMTINFVISVNSNDYLQIYWQSDNKDVSIETIAAGTTPATPVVPSIIVTATQV